MNPALTASPPSPRVFGTSSFAKEKTTHGNDVNPFGASTPPKPVSGSKKRKRTSKRDGSICESRSSKKHAAENAAVPTTKLGADVPVTPKIAGGRRHNDSKTLTSSHASLPVADHSKSIAPIRIIRTPRGYEVVRAPSNTTNEGAAAPHFNKLRILRTKEGVYKASPLPSSTPCKSPTSLPN